MIGFPFGVDQHHNAARMVAHGFGLRRNPNNVTSEELLDTINEVLSVDSYKRNIHKASQIMRSRTMNAHEEAAYWVEHVLQFGSEHLKSHAMDMPLYQYLMLDVLIVTGAIAILLTILIYCVFMQIFTILRGKICRRKVKIN